MVIKQNIQNTILSDGRPALLLVEQRSGEQMLDSDWSRLFPFMPLSQSLVLWSGQCRSIIRTAWGIHKDKIFGLLILFLSIQDTRRLSVCSKLYLVQKHLCCRLNWSRSRCGVLNKCCHTHNVHYTLKLNHRCHFPKCLFVAPGIPSSKYHVLLKLSFIIPTKVNIIVTSFNIVIG